MKRSLAAVLCLVSLLPCAVLAQQNPPSPQSLPKDPVALLKLASRVNGLHGDDLRPWHLHATWQLLSETSKPTEQGTFEEWWAAKDSIRVAISSPGFRQTRWVTKDGEFASGDQGWPSWVVRSLYSTLENPFPSEGEVAAISFQRHREKVGSIDLQCSEHTGENRAGLMKFCFSGDLLAVRIEENAVTRTLFNSILQFQGRYLPGDILVYRIDMPEIRIRIDDVEEIPRVQEVPLQPTADALPAASWISMSGRDLRPSRKIAGKVPDPPAESMERDYGNVEVAGILGKDGSLSSLEVVGGPGYLQKYTIDALRTWRFQPVLNQGEPTEGATTIAVAYHFHHSHLTPPVFPPQP